MEIGALAPYEQALRQGTRLGLRAENGVFVPLDVVRWLADADACDDTVLDRCVGPVLDVGCGPGRLVRALAARGVAVLGVDIAETAVALTRGQGLHALRRSVFTDLPGEGRWPTILLMDGNLGIGGDPLGLLVRTARLLGPEGRVIVESAHDPDADAQYVVRFTEDGVPVGPSFRWAEIGLRPLTAYAARVGLRLDETWVADGRCFSVLRPGVALAACESQLPR